MVRLFYCAEPVMSETPNYHISLWPKPPGSLPTYLCLLCPVKDASLPDILTHVTAAHAAAPVPTPLAVDVSVVPTLVRTEEAPDARGSADVLDRADQ